MEGDKMKRLVLLLSIALLITTFLSGNVLAAPPLHKVTGGGTVDFLGFPETYGFSAMQVDASGNAKGEMQFTWHYPSLYNQSDPFTMHADVTHIAVNTATGDAWIGGVVRKSSDPFYIGLGFVIRVQDNGEGITASGPDMISGTLMPTDPANALSQPSLPLVAFTHGNVQVK